MSSKAYDRLDERVKALEACVNFILQVSTVQVKTSELVGPGQFQVWPIGVLFKQLISTNTIAVPGVTPESEGIAAPLVEENGHSTAEPESAE